MNRSFSDDFKAIKQYHAVSVCVHCLPNLGLLTSCKLHIFIKRGYPHGLTVPVSQRGNLSALPGLGSLLHEMRDPEDRLHVAALACRGTFQRLFTWDRLNTMLVQGGWAWLRQYSKAYARVIYTAMVLIFAAIESYTLDDMAAMRTRLLALAGKLVVGPNGSPSPWKVRKSPYLKGPTLTIPLKIEGPASVSVFLIAIITHFNTPQGPQVQVAGGVVAADKATKTTAKAIPWKDRFEPPDSQTEHPPPHIVAGSACKHTKKSHSAEE